MTATLKASLMTALAEHRRAARVQAQTVAAGMGVARSTLSQWERGRRSPRWPAAVGYASQIGRRIVVTDGEEVLAEGLHLPALLSDLRSELSLIQDAVATRMQTSRSVISMFEGRTGHQLVSVERYVTVGLRLQLTHLAAA